MRDGSWFGFFMFLFVIASLGLLFYAIVESDSNYRKNKTECESKGGTYLSREGTCVQMQRIPLSGER